MRIAATVAIIFGGLTILSGGMAIFGGGQTRALFGDVVYPVLWFNFLSGFAYLLAGVGLWLGKRWSVWLSATVFLLIACTAVLLGLHIGGGGAYEARTVGAMIFRGAVWFAISWIAIRHIGWGSKNDRGE